VLRAGPRQPLLHCPGVRHGGRHGTRRARL
jgi:hypothetical protein